LRDPPAPDPDEDGCSSPDAGWIVYGLPRDDEYATGVNAKLVRGMWGTFANDRLKPPGYEKGHIPRLARGHLLDRQLGGSGDTLANLVTEYQSMNQGPMRRIEDRIRSAMESCEVVNFSAIPNYHTAGPLPVKSVTVTAVGNRGLYIHEPVPNVP